MPLSKESHMQMAITAWKEKRVKSKLRAMQIYGIALTTLCKRLTGIKSQSETRANGHKLTPIKEETLIKRLLDTDR